MAVSRLEKFGSIFSRCQGLIKSGHLKDDTIPMWFSIYERFPPHVEPVMDRPEPQVTLRKIFYPEDVERAAQQKQRDQSSNRVTAKSSANENSSSVASTND